MEQINDKQLPAVLEQENHTYIFGNRNYRSCLMVNLKDQMPPDCLLMTVFSEFFQFKQTCHTCKTIRIAAYFQKFKNNCQIHLSQLQARGNRPTHIPIGL